MSIAEHQPVAETFGKSIQEIFRPATDLLRAVAYGIPTPRTTYGEKQSTVDAFELLYEGTGLDADQVVDVLKGKHPLTKMGGAPAAGTNKTLLLTARHEGKTFLDGALWLFSEMDVQEKILPALVDAAQKQGIERSDLVSENTAGLLVKKGFTGLIDLFETDFGLTFDKPDYLIESVRPSLNPDAADAMFRAMYARIDNPNAQIFIDASSRKFARKKRITLGQSAAKHLALGVFQFLEERGLKKDTAYLYLAAGDGDRRSQRVAFAEYLVNSGYAAERMNLNPLFEKGCIPAALVYAEAGARVTPEHLKQTIEAVAEGRGGVKFSDACHLVDLLEKRGFLHGEKQEICNWMSSYASKLDSSPRNLKLISSLNRIADKLTPATLKQPPERTAPPSKPFGGRFAPFPSA